MEETKDKKGVMLDESFVESIFQNETMGLILEEEEMAFPGTDGLLCVCDHGSRDKIQCAEQRLFSAV